METQQQFRSLNKSHWSQCSIQRDVYGCHQVIQLDDGRAHAKSNCEVANSQLRGWARESCSFLPCVQLASTAHSLLWAEVLNPVQRLLFWGHRLRWVRHRGSNRCHYPLNWLGHASTFPSCLTLRTIIHCLHITVTSSTYSVHTLLQGIKTLSAHSHKLWRRMLISSGEISFVSIADLAD